MIPFLLLPELCHLVNARHQKVYTDGRDKDMENTGQDQRADMTEQLQQKF